MMPQKTRLGKYAGEGGSEGEGGRDTNNSKNYMAWDKTFFRLSGGVGGEQAY